MEKISQYVISVITAALILGILSSILDKKSGSAALIRMIGGLFLTFVIISPISKLNFSGLDDFLSAFSADAHLAASEGKSMAAEERNAIIKTRVEAYILDKAETYRAELEVDVTLSEKDTPVPVEARLRGDVSPYGKKQLQQMMEDDLGIAKENQLWIG